MTAKEPNKFYVPSRHFNRHVRREKFFHVTNTPFLVDCFLFHILSPPPHKKKIRLSSSFREKDLPPSSPHNTLQHNTNIIRSRVPLPNVVSITFFLLENFLARQMSSTWVINFLLPPFFPSFRFLDSFFF